MATETGAQKREDDPEVWWSGQREYARVEIDLPCVVDGCTGGKIRNISIGGALVRAAEGLAEVDDTVALEFEVGQGFPVDLFGEVLRISPREGQSEYGIEFVALEPEQRHQLLRSIERLLTGGGRGTRAAPRIHRQVGIKVTTAPGETFAGTMSDISRGGLGLLCRMRPTPGQELTVHVSDGPLETVLALPAVVAHVHRIRGGMLFLGLRFAHLSEQQQEELERLVSWMAYAPR